MHWDAVVIDESHNLIGERNLRTTGSPSAWRQADRRADARSRHPAQRRRAVVRRADRLLDPAASPDDRNYAAEDIAPLYIRRTKISDEVSERDRREMARAQGPRRRSAAPHPGLRKMSSPRLTRVWLARTATVAPGAGTGVACFPGRWLKAFLSVTGALRSHPRASAREHRSTQTGARQRSARLAALANQVADDDSAKYTAWCAT